MKISKAEIACLVATIFTLDAECIVGQWSVLTGAGGKAERGTTVSSNDSLRVRCSVGWLTTIRRYSRSLPHNARLPSLSIHYYAARSSLIMVLYYSIYAISKYPALRSQTHRCNRL
jgi:hypothetical protein